MNKAVKTAVYDETLGIEAYNFQGIVQPFPNHFHEYYVIGYVEKGERRMSCRDRHYVIRSGEAVIFCPGDSHACIQSDDEVMDYRGLNIPQEVMLSAVEEMIGKRDLPGFSETVISDEEIICCLSSLHEMVMTGSADFCKEEKLLLLVSMLLRKYGTDFESRVPECRKEIEKACIFMEEHFAEHISLDQICSCTGLSRSTLLRAFTKSKSMTPYSYLENIRIGKARKLLEQGMTPVEAAMQTGFSDQSHFTNYFSRFIGLAPGAYRQIFSVKGEDRR